MSDHQNLAEQQYIADDGMGRRRGGGRRAHDPGPASQIRRLALDGLARRRHKSKTAPGSSRWRRSDAGQGGQRRQAGSSTSSAILVNVWPCGRGSATRMKTGGRTGQAANRKIRGKTLGSCTWSTKTPPRPSPSAPRPMAAATPSSSSATRSPGCGMRTPMLRRSSSCVRRKCRPSGARSRSLHSRL